MFCSCKPIVNISERGRKVSKTLENLNYAYIILAFIKLLLGDFNSFINDLLTIFLLIMTFMQASFFMAGLLIFIVMFQTFYVLVFDLLILQNWYFNLMYISFGVSGFYVFIMYVSLVLNVTLIYFIFQAYKEYKALFYEQMAEHSRNNYRNNYFL
jgi:hypothetical protein